MEKHLARIPAAMALLVEVEMGILAERVEVLHQQDKDILVVAVLALVLMVLEEAVVQVWQDRQEQALLVVPVVPDCQAQFLDQV